MTSRWLGPLIGLYFAVGCLTLAANWVGATMAGPRPCDAQASAPRVERVPTSPPARSLGECRPGDVVESATGRLWLVPALAPGREPWFGSTTGGPPIPNAGSRPVGWPEVATPPAGWVYALDLASGRLDLMPASWRVWPVADWRATVRTSH